MFKAITIHLTFGQSEYSFTICFVEKCPSIPRKQQEKRNTKKSMKRQKKANLVSQKTQPDKNKADLP